MIKKEIIVNKDNRFVWEKWSTSEGLKSFFGEDNNMELRKGGTFEIYFDMNQPKGLRGSEGCKILDFIPQKLLSFSWNAPPSIPEIRNNDYKTMVSVFFKSLKDDKTAITLVHHGFLKGEKWIEYHKYFEKAWDIVLNRFKDATCQ